MLYYLCCDAMDLINVCFGVQVLLFTCMTYVHSIFAIFATFRLWYSAPDTQEGIMVFKQLLWTSYYYVFVLAVIAVASSLTNQVGSVSGH